MVRFKLLVGILIQDGEVSRVATIDDLLKKLPSETREVLRWMWEALSPADRSGPQALLSGLPPDAALLRLVTAPPTRPEKATIWF